MSKWKRILELQNRLHPGWLTTKPRTLYTTGLASEIGEVCDQVTHMDGGGSQVFDPTKWNDLNLLYEIVDSYVMLVLVAAKSGFTESNFETVWRSVERKLVDRVNQRTVKEAS